MTEGIIQKVVDRYYGRAHINVLEGIKKELIEEIIMLNVFQNNPMLMKLLIGDSK